MFNGIIFVRALCKCEVGVNIMLLLLLLLSLAYPLLAVNVLEGLGDLPLLLLLVLELIA